jgi:hypothetical protein
VQPAALRRLRRERRGQELLRHLRRARPGARLADRGSALPSEPGPAAGTPPPITGGPIEPAAGGIGRGVVFALGGGVLGALLWFGSVVLTNYKIGFAAVGVGLIVGYAAFLGNGKQPSGQLALLSVIVAMAAIFAGEYLTVSHQASKAGLSETMSFELFLEYYKADFSPIDVLFYAIGAFEAYKLPSAGKPA